MSILQMTKIQNQRKSNETNRKREKNQNLFKKCFMEDQRRRNQKYLKKRMEYQKRFKIYWMKRLLNLKEKLICNNEAKMLFES